MGCLVKLMNNLVSLGSHLLVQEVLALGAKAGIEPLSLHEMLSKGTAGPFVGAVPEMLARDWDDATFTLALSAKDISLCLDAARELGVPMAMGASAGQIYARSLARGLGSKAKFATLAAIEADAGTQVGAPPAKAKTRSLRSRRG
jgi:3-hydroxyisobutyrate dehydrogenase